jgi:hypothetical protein
MEQLGISTFIMPAFYLKIFDRCYWLRCHQMPVNTEQKGLVYSHGQEGEKLVFTADSFENRLNYPDGRGVTIFFQTRYEHFPEDAEVVLDIDLDYFSSNIPPDNFSGRIETTEGEYLDFQANRYHYLRLINDKVSAVREDGRFFFVYNHVSVPIPSATRVSESVIDERVADFLAFLKRKRVKPRLIDLCRSRFSNYTPADQWHFIETRLLTGLKEIYDPEVSYIGDLVEKRGLWATAGLSKGG